MAIGAIGNAVFIHQNMHVIASKATDQLNRFDIQNFMAAEFAKDKDKEVTEVRPAEEGHAIDPEREEHAQEEEQEKREEKREKKEHSGLHSDTPNLHILDIKV